MRYELEIVVNLPRSRVIELFDDPDNLAKWQPGMRSYQHLSGEPGQPGAKARLEYDEGGRKVELIETILRRDLPEAFNGYYEGPGVKNWIRNRFVEEGPDQTRWIVDTEFAFSGLMKIMAPFMRGGMAKQTQTFMHNFEAFAETTQTAG